MCIKIFYYKTTLIFLLVILMSNKAFKNNVKKIVKPKDCSRIILDLVIYLQ